MKTFAVLVFMCFANLITAQSTCESDGGVFYRNGHEKWERSGIRWSLKLATSHEKEHFPMSDFSHALILSTDRNGVTSPLKSYKLGEFAGATNSGDGYVTLTWIASNETIYQVILNDEFKMDSFHMTTQTGVQVQCECKS